MARPQKNNADWFSHDTNLRDDLKIKAIRTKYGLEGYAVFLMLLEVLADAECFEIEDQEFQIEMLAGDFRIESKLLHEIISYFQTVGLIQRENGKIISQHLIDRMDPLLSKRERMREKYLEKSQQPKPSETPKKPKAELMTEEDFDAFWKEYPIKEDKKKAREKFLKLKKELFPKIMQSISDNKIKNKKRTEGFIKLPTTRIHGECWNDELPDLVNNNGQNAGYKRSSEKGQGKISEDGNFDVEV